MSDRYLIANDKSGKWYVRRIRVVEHDMDRDEKVYRCDLPVGTAYNSLSAAVDALQLARSCIGDLQ
jgi:hypothetical protein